MTGASVSVQANQILEVMGHFGRLKPRLAAVVPADLNDLKERLVEIEPECCPVSANEYNLFYRTGAILSDALKPLTMSDLSEALAVPLSSATRTIDWMVKNEFAERLPDPADRRVVRVNLTGKGRRYYRGINEFILARIEHVLRRLKPEERTNLVALLRKVVAVMEEET